MAQTFRVTKVEYGNVTVDDQAGERIILELPKELGIPLGNAALMKRLQVGEGGVFRIVLGIEPQRSNDVPMTEITPAEAAAQGVAGTDGGSGGGDPAAGS